MISPRNKSRGETFRLGAIESNWRVNDPESKRVISPPVNVWVTKRERGGVRVVSSLFVAVEVLHQNWPANHRGRKWKTAARTCVAAYEGKKSVNAAREALVAAAEPASCDSPRRQANSAKAPHEVTSRALDDPPKSHFSFVSRSSQIKLSGPIVSCRSASVSQISAVLFSVAFAWISLTASALALYCFASSRIWSLFMGQLHMSQVDLDGTGS
jgi:Protein of unknown function (DUF982)